MVGLFKKVMGNIYYFIKNHPVISISIGLIILIFAFILILHRLSKKQEEEKKNDGRNRGKSGADLEQQRKLYR